MVDLNALNSILSTRNGVWATFMVLVLMAWRGWPHIPAVIAAWSARRQSIQAAKDADWARIRDRLEAVESRHEKCERDLLAEREQRVNDMSSLREELGRERAERMRFERLLFAEGEIRQAGAAAQAEVRADPAKAPTSREKFEGSGGK